MGLGLGLEGSGGLGLLSGLASAGRQARQALEQSSDERCGRAGVGQVDGDPGFEFDDAGGDLASSRRSVSNWAWRPAERGGSAASRVHISQ